MEWSGERAPRAAGSECVGSIVATDIADSLAETAREGRNMADAPRFSRTLNFSQSMIEIALARWREISLGHDVEE
jgi:hypothetical protein